jgi:sugar phosphate permease
VLSLSFIGGGTLAVVLSGFIGHLTHDSWRAILAMPSIVLAVIALITWARLPKSSSSQPIRDGQAAASARVSARRILSLFSEKQFLILLGLSFTLTLVRETFNFWTVDFIRTEAGPSLSNSVASFLSTPFDLCGGAGIVLMGWGFGKLGRPARRKLVVAILLGLTMVLVALPLLFRLGVWLLAAGIGLVGFLVYGPYTLLGGVLSLEVRGKEYAATVSGLVDGSGYFAGLLSGFFFGRLLMLGGYRLGFQVMASLTLVAAGLACFLYRERKRQPAARAALVSRELNPLNR